MADPLTLKPEFDISQDVLLQPTQTKKWWGRVVSCGSYLLGGASVVATVGLSVLRYLDFRSWSNNPVGGALSSVGIGASAMTALEFLAPRRLMDCIHQFQAKNALYELFMLSQIYLNLDEDNPAHQTFKTILGVLGGSWMVLKVAMLVRRRMNYQAERAQYKNLGKSHVITVLLEPRGGKALIIAEVAKASLGLSMVSVYYALPGVPVDVRNWGVIICGRRLGKYIAMGFNNKKVSMEAAQLEESDEETPLLLRVMRGASRALSLLANNAWGVLFVFKNPVTLFGVGVLTGGTKESGLRKFQKAPMPTSSPDWKAVEKVQKYANVIFTLGFSGWFLWGISSEISAKDLVDCLALVAFGLGVAQGAVLTHQINNVFEPGKNTALVNTARFYTTEHTASLAIVPLYVMMQYEGIGDLYLADYSSLGKTIAVGTWFLYGNVLGNDWAQRYPVERFPATADALMGTFLARWSRGHI